MLAMVLQSVGLPVEGIALVAGVDRILDMMRALPSTSQATRVVPGALTPWSVARPSARPRRQRRQSLRERKRSGIPRPRSATVRLRLAMRLAPSLHFRRKSIFEAQRVLKNAGPASARFFRLVCEFVCGDIFIECGQRRSLPQTVPADVPVRQPHGCRTYELKSRPALQAALFLYSLKACVLGVVCPQAVM